MESFIEVSTNLVHKKCGGKIEILRALTGNSENYFYWFCCYNCDPEGYVKLDEVVIDGKLFKQSNMGSEPKC
jgi:hypothetical protein